MLFSSIVSSILRNEAAWLAKLFFREAAAVSVAVHEGKCRRNAVLANPFQSQKSRFSLLSIPFQGNELNH